MRPGSTTGPSPDGQGSRRRWRLARRLPRVGAAQPPVDTACRRPEPPSRVKPGAAGHRLRSSRAPDGSGAAEAASACRRRRSADRPVGRGGGRRRRPSRPEPSRSPVHSPARPPPRPAPRPRHHRASLPDRGSSEGHDPSRDRRGLARHGEALGVELAVGRRGGLGRAPRGPGRGGEEPGPSGASGNTGTIGGPGIARSPAPRGAAACRPRPTFSAVPRPTPSGALPDRPPDRAHSSVGGRASSRRPGLARATRVRSRGCRGRSRNDTAAVCREAAVAPRIRSMPRRLRTKPWVPLSTRWGPGTASSWVTPFVRPGPPRSRRQTGSGFPQPGPPGARGDATRLRGATAPMAGTIGRRRLAPSPIGDAAGAHPRARATSRSTGPPPARDAPRTRAP